MKAQGSVYENTRATRISGCKHTRKLCEEVETLARDSES